MLDIDTTIVAKARRAGKKGQARKLRGSGELPAVVYGPKQSVTYLSLDPKSFVMQRRRFGQNALYDLHADGVNTLSGRVKCLIKEIQVHPVSRAPLHVDLYAVDMERPLRVEVPVELTGKAAGIIDGGLLSQVLRSVEVECLPRDIPGKLEADVTKLGIGDSLHLSDIVLPKGVKLTSHGDDAVATLSEPEAAIVAPAADAAAATPAAGAAATAAAPAKAPAKSGDKK